jgi:aldehyde dehydrogenase (NAD+)
VLKPAELTPASAHALVAILHEAGAPPGVVNLVLGRGSVLGDVLAGSPRVDALSFTGSVPTGRRIAARCAERGIRVQCEMGGKNPPIVVEDADLDVAAAVAANGAFFSTGQRCTASSPLIVTEGIHDRFVAVLEERMRGLRVGRALDPQTEIGPVVDERQLEQNERYLAIAKDEGARVVGRARARRETEGYFLKPALFIDTEPDMRVNREEIFGPIASVIRLKDYEAALATANDTGLGLSAGICTTSLATARHFKRHVEAGMVMVNLATGRGRLSCPVRRPQRLQLRPARAGCLYS